jgi:hypothetical protein
MDEEKSEEMDMVLLRKTADLKNYQKLINIHFLKNHRIRKLHLKN